MVGVLLNSHRVSLELVNHDCAHLFCFKVNYLRKIKDSLYNWHEWALPFSTKTSSIIHLRLIVIFTKKSTSICSTSFKLYKITIAKMQSEPPQCHWYTTYNRKSEIHLLNLLVLLKSQGCYKWWLLWLPHQTISSFIKWLNIMSSSSICISTIVLPDKTLSQTLIFHACF